MGVGVEASGASPPYATELRQPAYGEHSDEPQVQAQDKGCEQETAGDRFARRAQWPVLVVLAATEIAWLIGLVYVIHRFVLSPLFG